MGTRYAKILEEEGIEFYVLDQHNLGAAKRLFEHTTKAIIATPTELHTQYVTKCIEREIPVLCEKPITKNVDELERILNHRNAEVFLHMVCNYKYAYQKAKDRYGDQLFYQDKKTRYMFENSGKDGLAWDCIQLIYLAEGRVQFGRSGKTWTCYINGVPIRYQDVIEGYRQMLLDFMADRLETPNKKRLLGAHKCAEKIQEIYAYNTSGDRNTAETEEFEVTL